MGHMVVVWYDLPFWVPCKQRLLHRSWTFYERWPLSVEGVVVLANVIRALWPHLDDSVRPITNLGHRVEHHIATGLSLATELVTLVEDVTVVSITCNQQQAILFIIFMQKWLTYQVERTVKTLPNAVLYESSATVKAQCQQALMILGPAKIKRLQ